MRLHNRVWKFFCSVKLTVWLLVLIMIASILGTVIIQDTDSVLNEKPEIRTHLYGQIFDQIFRSSGLYDVYGVWWFIILLLMLNVNVAICTLNRFSTKLRHIGSMITHFSIVLILVGALIGAVAGEKGMVTFFRGETVEHTHDATGQLKADLGFQLYLKDLSIEKQPEPIERLLVASLEKNKQERFPMEIGKRRRVLGRKYEIEVLRYFPDAHVEVKLEERSAEPVNPAIEFEVYKGDEARGGWLFAKPPASQIIEEAGLGLTYKWVDDKETYERELQQIEPAKTYRLRVLEFVPDFVIDLETKEISTKSDTPNNPAIFVEIDDSTGKEMRWLFAKFPGFGESHGPGEGTLDLSYEWLDLEGHTETLGILRARLRDPGITRQFVVEKGKDMVFSASLPIMMKVVGGPGMQNKMSIAKHGTITESIPIEAGQKYSIEGTDYAFRVARFFADAATRQEVVNRSEQPRNPSIEVAVTGPEGRSKHWMFADVPRRIGKLQLLYSRDFPISDYKSQIEVRKDGVTVKSKTIEVNDPLRFEGYVFYQHQMGSDEQGRAWSRLSVKNDPGVPFVYSGFILLTIGIAFVFYLQPLFRKGRASAEPKKT